MTEGLSRWVPMVLAAGMASAQPALTTFAVATVKENKSMTEAMGGGFQPGGDLLLRNRTLKNLIEMAYRVDDYRINGPAWMTTAKYDVVAKPASPVDHNQTCVMLQNLLADRFGLRVHREPTTVQGFILTAERGAGKLTRTDTPREGFEIMSMEEIKGPATMAALARVLRGTLGKPVEDRTGLSDKYVIQLKWTAHELQAGSDAASEPGLSIFTALKQQLGLALKANKISIEMLVVDHAERQPVEN